MKGNAFASFTLFLSRQTFGNYRRRWQMFAFGTLIFATANLNVAPAESSEQECGDSKSSMVALPHTQKRLMFWWLPVGGAERTQPLLSLLSQPYLVVYSPLEDSVHPSGSVSVSWRISRSLLGGFVQILVDDSSEYKSMLQSELQYTTFEFEPGSHVISIALLNSSCKEFSEMSDDGDCEVVRYTISFLVVERSLAWQEPEKPYIITEQDLDDRFLYPPPTLLCDGHVGTLWNHICGSDSLPAANTQVSLRIFNVRDGGVCCTSFRTRILMKLSEAWHLQAQMYIDGQLWRRSLLPDELLCGLEAGAHVLTLALSADNGTRVLHESALSHVFVESGCDGVDGGGTAPPDRRPEEQAGRAAAPLRTAWATMVYSESYLAGALTMFHSLARACRHAEKRDMILMATPPLTAKLDLLNEVLTQQGVTLRWVTPFASPHDPNRPEDLLSYTKLNLWNLTEYHKVVYIDADALVRRCPHEVFESPHFVASSMPATRHTLPPPYPAYRDVQLTSCALLVLPSPGLFQELLDSTGTLTSFDGTDMGFIEHFFGSKYPASSGLLHPHVVTWKGTYAIYPLVWTAAEVQAVDFSGAPKPWDVPWVGPGRAGPTHFDPFRMANYYPLLLEWWEAFWDLCGTVPPARLSDWVAPWPLAHGRADTFNAVCLGAAGSAPG